VSTQFDSGSILKVTHQGQHRFDIDSSIAEGERQREDSGDDGDEDDSVAGSYDAELRGGVSVRSDILRGPLGPPSPWAHTRLLSKPYLDWFIRFCRALTTLNHCLALAA